MHANVHKLSPPLSVSYTHLDVYKRQGGFNQNNGLLKVDKRNNFNNNIDLKTYSVRSNVNVNLTPTTQIDVRVSGTFDEYVGPISGGTQAVSYTHLRQLQWSYQGH